MSEANTMSKEAMTLALEALQVSVSCTDMYYVPLGKSMIPEIEEAIKTLEEALAKQEQGEPVAWMFQHEETGRIMFVEAQQLEWGFEKGNPRLKKIGPLYTTPPQSEARGLSQQPAQKPLTDEQIYDMYNEPRSDAEILSFAREIEAAHGIKENT